MENILLGYIYDQDSLSDADARKLTHLNLAFGELDTDGRICVAHMTLLQQIPRLKKANPALKICLSLVNHRPEAFATVCADEALRKVFAASCVEMITKHGFDGIDLDWEYPCVPSNGMDASPADRDHFTAACREIRAALDTISEKHALLTIAAGADVYYPACVDLPAITPLLDYICLMTYDLKCGFHALSGHHTALYASTGDYFRNSCDQALRLFVSCGVPKEKLLLGAAFYSRAWHDLPNRNHGFLQLCKSGGGYGPDYTELTERYINQNGYTRYWDEEAKAPYLFNGSTFISYDDPQSLAEKCAYVRREGYRGIFYWEHNNDKTGTLLDALHRGMQAE